MSRSLIWGGLALSALVTILHAQAPVEPGPYPLVDRIPAGSLLYIGWAGHNETFIESRAGQLLCSRAFVSLVQEGISRRRKQSSDELQPLWDGVLGLGGVLWRNPSALALVELGRTAPANASLTSAPAEGEIIVSAVLLIRPGADKPILDESLQVVTAMLPPDLLRQDGAFTAVDLPVPVVFGYDGDLFIVAIGKGTLDRLRACGREESLLADASFAQAMAEVGPAHARGDAIAGEAQFAPYADTARLAEAIRRLDKELVDNVVDAAPQAAGLEKLRSIAAEIRVVDGGLYMRVRLATPAPHGGMLGAFLASQLTEEDLKLLPRDADVAGVFKVSGPRFRQAGEALGEIGQINDDIACSAAELEEKTGVSMAEDVFGCLGETWTYHGRTNAAGQVERLIISADVTDAARLSSSLEKLTAYAAEAGAAEGLRFTTEQVGQLTVHSLVFPQDFSLPLLAGKLVPSWCVHGNRLYISLSPAALAPVEEGYTESLADDEAFARARAYLSGQASSLTYVNTPALLANLAQLRLAGQETEAAELATLAEGCLPQVQAIWADEGGVTIEGYSSGMPSRHIFQTPVLTAPMVALALPSLQRAKQMAKETLSVNRLRQIHYGMLFYADVNDGALPPHLQALCTDDFAVLTSDVLISPVTRQPYVYFPIKAPDGEPVMIACDAPDAPQGKRMHVLMSDGEVRHLDLAAFEQELARSRALLQAASQPAGP